MKRPSGNGGPAAALLAAFFLAACVQPYEYKYYHKGGKPPGKDAGGDVPDAGGGEVELAKDASADACKPSCKGKQCGPDGCGGTCGKCSENGECTPEGKCICPAPHEACFGACCELGLVCNVETGKCCKFDCFDRECGKICGKSCGTCPPNKLCSQEGKCKCAKPLCGVTCCEADETCVGDTCCKPGCAGKECGPDGCGGSCGDCAAPSGPCVQSVCETGKCQDKPKDGTCDDSDPCTTGDACVGGECAGIPTVCDDSKACTLDSCEPATGECLSDPDALDGTACDDGSPCTKEDKCEGGKCAGTPLPPEELALLQCPCTKTSDCAPLEDGNVCNGSMYCPDTDKPPAMCAVDPDSIPKCDDGNECTDDGCDKVLGCVHPDDDTNPCSDGNACTIDDHCEAGTCTGSQPPDCDDQNACTIDDCDPAKGCTNTPLPDGTLCGQPDWKCIEGTCTYSP